MNKYKNTLTEIEDINNSLEQIGSDVKWFEWIDTFGVQIQEKRDIPDTMKKEILRTILENIIVDYDNEEKVHRLTINFKIPVMFRDEDRPSGVVVKCLLNPRNQVVKIKIRMNPFVIILQSWIRFQRHLTKIVFPRDFHYDFPFKLYLVIFGYQHIQLINRNYLKSSPRYMMKMDGTSSRYQIG